MKAEKIKFDGKGDLFDDVEMSLIFKLVVWSKQVSTKIPGLKA